ncbi:hypothetical protein BJ875DRAFT_542147 [Amylocarpus encephaloides]|uniref:Uncharacterized protein n=1 Tax=Amylocarpus encephaloides TaxID=45428 RepID=A0A9P7YKD5_9HELO|nr:hypothetical protein BJ875DRAFT_542147 [Amylocarpus encephaloides]
MTASLKTKGEIFGIGAELVETIPGPKFRKFEAGLANPEETRYPNFPRRDVNDSYLITEHQDDPRANLDLGSNPGWTSQDTTYPKIPEGGQTLDAESPHDVFFTWREKTLRLGYVNSRSSKANNRDELDGLEHEMPYHLSKKFSCHDGLDGLWKPLNISRPGSTIEDARIQEKVPTEFTIINTVTDNKEIWHMVKVKPHILYPISSGAFEQQLVENVTTCGDYEPRDSAFPGLFNNQNHQSNAEKKLHSKMNRQTQVLGAQLFNDGQERVGDEVAVPEKTLAALVGLENMEDDTAPLDIDDHLSREIPKKVDEWTLSRFNRPNENRKESRLVYEVVMDENFKVNYFASCRLAAIKENAEKMGLIEARQQEDTVLECAHHHDCGDEELDNQPDSQPCSTVLVEVDPTPVWDENDSIHVVQRWSTWSDVSSDDDGPFSLEKHLLPSKVSKVTIPSPISSLQPDAYNLLAPPQKMNMEVGSPLLTIIGTLASTVEKFTKTIMKFTVVVSKKGKTAKEKLQYHTAAKKGICDDLTSLNQQVVAVNGEIVFKEVPFEALTTLRVLGSFDALCSCVEELAHALMGYSGSKASVACMGSRNKILEESLVKVQKNMTRLINGIDRRLLLQSIEELKKDEGRRVFERSAAAENYNFNKKLSHRQKQLVNGGIRNLDIELHEVRGQLEALRRQGARVKSTNSIDLLTQAQQTISAIVQNKTFLINRVHETNLMMFWGAFSSSRSKKRFYDRDHDV